MNYRCKTAGNSYIHLFSHSYVYAKIFNYVCYSKIFCAKNRTYSRYSDIGWRKDNIQIK